MGGAEGLIPGRVLYEIDRCVDAIVECFFHGVLLGRLSGSDLVVMFGVSRNLPM